MKSYHLTPEQVLEIASNLELDGRDITVWTNGYVEFETKEALQIFANAVLDQVLGEPVAEAFIDSFGDLKIYPTGIASKALIVAIGDSKLYAPKELP